MQEQPLNIVELIENNPITQLNGTYQSKLIAKIKTHFNEYEQQMFVASFYCYLNYDSETDFVIDLDNIWKWLGFGQKVNAKTLLEKNFTIDKDYKLLLSSGNQTFSDKTTRGGHNKETFMLSVETFKMFCMKAGTKKADEIHKYYIKMERILQSVLQEKATELTIQIQIKDQQMQQLQQQQEDSKAEIDRIETAHKKDYVHNMALAKEQMLLKEYGTSGALVYIIKVKTYKTSAYVIKIGESRMGIQARYDDHRHSYEECLLLDCFSVLRSKEFEKFIHEHDGVRTERTYELEGHERERELFLIGHRLSYNALTKIIKSNIKTYNEYTVQETESFRVENDTLRQTIALLKSAQHQTPNNSLLLELVESNKQIVEMSRILLERVGLLENALNKTNSISLIKTTTNFGEVKPTIGPRLQCIHPDTLNLVKVYQSATECMNENDKIKRPSLTKAVQENTAYHGFRWMFVDRELDPSIVSPTIAPTRPTQKQNLGYIAKITPDNSEILNVYLDRKTAAISNGYSASGLDTPVKNGTLANTYYYRMYDDCDENLTNSFVSNKNGGNEPLLFKNGLGQYNENHLLVREFACKYDCIRTLKMSDKTLQKAIDTGSSYNQCYYKMIGARLVL